jgi:hypothetical protein
VIAVSNGIVVDEFCRTAQWVRETEKHGTVAANPRLALRTVSYVL